MTLEDWTKEIAATAGPDEPVQLDPVTIFVLLTLIGSVVTALVTKCVDRIWPDKAKDPGPLARLYLKHVIRQESKRLQAAGAQPGVSFPALEVLAYNRLLRWRQQATTQNVLDVIAAVKQRV